MLASLRDAIRGTRADYTRTALQNAASIAGLMITTEAMVAEAPKKDEPMPVGGHGPRDDSPDANARLGVQSGGVRRSPRAPLRRGSSFQV